MSTKRTYQPSKRKRAKKHGFLSRLKSSAGKNLILRRRRKGRKQLAVPTHRKNG
ncbi:MAG: 50S ribosomal protein L34 [Candidatus Pacebacteria bacterium]|nr:50S ribosomal protein L34 [Candidatus Paceibacterota bacterium]